MGFLARNRVFDQEAGFFGQAPKLTTSQIYRNHKFLYLATLYANELTRANFIREGQSKSSLNLELLWLKSKDLWNNATTTDPSM